MRSIRGFIAAGTILLSFVAAVVVEQVFGGGGDTVVHLVMGTGLAVFAASMFDFGLPRWVNIVGAAAAGAFAAIFLLQGVSDLTPSEGLRHFAFDILGQHVERLLPDVVLAWFVALVLGASRGKSRILGGVIMLVVVGFEITALIGMLLDVPTPSVKLFLLLPFVWLLVESVERQPPTPSGLPGRAGRIAHHEPVPGRSPAGPG